MNDVVGTRTSLKHRLQSGENIRLIEAHNGISALVANSVRDELRGVEFDAIWVSSLTCTASVGLPDLELTLVDNRLGIVDQIARTSQKPIIVDGDTGGDVSSLRYYCRALSRLGVAGIIVEDKAVPKRNSLSGAQQHLAEPHEFADKLIAAKEGVDDPDFMVIARIESLIAGAGPADALRRSLIYTQAGVDGILIHSKSREAAEVEDFAREFRALGLSLPLYCVPTTYHDATADRLFLAGIQGVIYANHQLRAARAAMEAACRAILRDDCSTRIENEISSPSQIFDDVGYSAEVRFVEGRDRAGSLARAG